MKPNEDYPVITSEIIQVNEEASAMIDELSGHDEVPNEDCIVWVQLPWSVPNEEPEVFAYDGGYQSLGWHDLDDKMLNYDGDSKKDDNKNDEEGKDSGYGEGDGRQDNYGQVPIVDEDANDGNDDIIKEFMDSFEGYQSKYDDEYF
ncbi:hypothetical protein LWI28_001547 [Acer negundo]|uniref:Uncharacterized protein n=1 Tax=Acer negundo TaxID=4023 RepID=A0AAD5NEP1_ACENE|nr:hypothetical protein LWI28_001547 [Acer negundo]